MTKLKENNKFKKILICNDDGYNSDGLKVLINFAHSIAEEVWVVVPSEQRSAGGHAISIFRPLRLHNIAHAKHHYTIDGTPADAVILALHYLMEDDWPMAVFSGINIGNNLAENTYYSGTVAAAREAVLHGLPAVAFSQCYDDHHAHRGKIDFSAAEQCLPEVWQFLLQEKFLINGGLYNVNFPAYIKPCQTQSIEMSKLGRQRRKTIIEARIDMHENQYFWFDQKVVNQTDNYLDQITAQAQNITQTAELNLKSDLQVISEGKVSITKLRLD